MEHLDKENEFDVEERPKCKLCLAERSRYTCPRCNVAYCSVACYKSQAHADCSEGFYKDCFMEGLKDMESPGEKHKVMEILKRISDQQEDDLDSDDEDEEDLAERLKGLDLDTDTDGIWSRLTDRERAEFQGMLSDGRLSELVRAWQPWWATNLEKPTLVEELKNYAESGEGVTPHLLVSGVPHIPEDIQDIDILLKNKTPSESIRYSIINIIYAYAYITRLYNGDYGDMMLECTQELLLLSGALGVQQYTSVHEAVQNCVQALANQSLYVSEAYSVGVVEDVQHIVRGPAQRTNKDYGCTYVMAVLSDVQDMCEQAGKELKKQKHRTRSADGSTLPKSTDRTNRGLQQLIFSVCKKCDFLLAWSKKYGHELLEMLPQIQLEYCEMSSRLAAHQHTEAKVHKLREKAAPKHRLSKLIEEIPPSGAPS